MVPPDSDRAPPTPPYSGYGLGSSAFRVRGCHPLRPAFPGAFRYALSVRIARPATPGAPRRPRFGLAPFRSPLLGGSLLFSFPPATWMFRFAGLASALCGCRASRAAGYPIRASADPWLLAPPRGLSRPAAPFVAPGSQGIPRAPSLARSPPGLPARGPPPRAPARLSCVFSPLSHPVNEPPRTGSRSAYVENAGLEPATPGLQSRCSSQLSQSPIASNA